MCSEQGVCVEYVEPDGDDLEDDGAEIDTDVSTDGPIIRVEPASIDFGSTNELHTSRTLDINNDGNKPLYLSFFSFLGVNDAFSIEPAVPAGTTIKPGAKISINIVYTPPAACKKYEVPLTISSNASNRPALEVVMKAYCKGVSALFVEPCSLDFGSVRTGQSFSKSVKICNKGTDNKPISISTFALTNSATAADFGLVFDPMPTQDAPLTIRPGDANCVDLTAVYHPQDVTVFPDTDRNVLYIKHDADQNSLCAAESTPGGELSLPLNGISGDYAMGLSRLEFGSIEKATPLLPDRHHEQSNDDRHQSQQGRS